MNRHLSQDDLLQQLYGVGCEDLHLRACTECAARLAAMQRARAAERIAAEARWQAPVSLFAAQRRAIYRRLDAAAASHVRWAPALAGAGLLAVGLLLVPHAPVQAPRTPDAAVTVELTSDEKMVSDLYSMEQSFEPSADAPIHALFDDGSAGGEQ
jgi:predicted anti-sigma-YlaC factor YlaD